MRASTDTADDDDAAAALSVVVLYGTAAIVVIPALASFLGLSPAQLGVWAGAAVHEVAQVAAIGAASGVLAAAVTVKLARVILLAPIVALKSLQLNNRGTARLNARGAERLNAGGAEKLNAGDAEKLNAGDAERLNAGDAEKLNAGGAGRLDGGRAGRPPVVPLFVAAFLVMVAVRSTGRVPATVTDAVPYVTNILMAAALFGLGTGIDVRKLIRGGRALLLGAAATGIITAVSLAGVALLV
jgi:uncharacterized membrane protein YadS